jgi:pilus assembly protein CpaF
MPSELRAAAERIMNEFESAWSYDGRDFNRPSADQVLRELCAREPEESRARLTAEFFGAGPLEPYLELQDLQEILVNGADEIWIERSGRLERAADSFLTSLTFKNFIDRLCGQAAIKVDLAQPFADGRWRGFRVHLGRAPLTHCEFHLSLRKIPENPWTLERLRESGWCTSAQLAALRSLIQERKNLLFIGPTGCGKTTVLGACLRELRPDDRTVILEDTDELPRPNAASTKMLTRPFASEDLKEVTLSDLVRQSLRMRPSRVVLGEVRGAEAKDLVLALATGHQGSLGTLHASDPRQALLRLEMLVQLGAPQWSVQTVRQLIQLSVDALVICGNQNGHRRLEGMYRVAALEAFGFLIEPIV